MKISDKNFVSIKPTAFFLRLIAIGQRENNIKIFFSYELTTFPMSLFKNGLIQKPKQATLFNTLVTKKVDIDTNSLHVLDGGALLDTVRWPRFLRSLQALCSSHHSKTWHQSNCIWRIQPSTKDHDTQEEVSIRGAVQTFNTVFQQRSTLRTKCFSIKQH